MLWVFHSCFNVNNNLKIPFDQSATYLTLFYKALCQIKIAAFKVISKVCNSTEQLYAKCMVRNSMENPRER